MMSANVSETLEPPPSVSGPRPRHKRFVKNFLLDRTFQLKYTLLIALAGGIIFGSVEYFFYDKVRENSELAGLTEDPELALQLQVELAAEDQKVLIELVGYWVLLVSLLVVVGVLATHRIVGPIYVVDRYIQRIKEGAPVHPRPLRKGDEFQALYNHVNEMCEALHDERRHDHDVLALVLTDLAVRLEQLERDSPEGMANASMMREVLRPAREMLNAKRAYLDAPVVT